MIVYPPVADDMHFSVALRNLGWVDGRNVITEYRFVQGQLIAVRLPSDLAAELVGLKVDLIVAI